MFAVVKIAEEETLEQEAQRNAGRNRDRQRQPERPGGPNDQERRIRAHHEQAAVGQVDDPQHAEDEREAARDQKQQQPVLQPVE